MKRSVLFLSVLIVALSLGVAAGSAFAASAAGSGGGTGKAAKAGKAKGSGADSGYEDFNPSGKEEQVNAPLFVTIAYSVIWLVPLFYLIGLWRRQARLRDEVAVMRRDLGLADDKAPKRSA